MAKIVIIDNFGRDSVSDRLHSEGHTEEEAESLVRDLNADARDDGPDYYVVKPDDYQLYQFQP